MTAPIDRARLRALAEKARDTEAAYRVLPNTAQADDVLRLGRARNNASHALEHAASPDAILALLDALDAAERERDAARQKSADYHRRAQQAEAANYQHLKALNRAQGVPLSSFARALTYGAMREAERERDALAALLRECRDVATGWQDHYWMGACPGLDAGFNSRDPNCPACAVLLRVEAALAAREPT